MNLDSIEVWMIALGCTVVVWAGFSIFSRWCAQSHAVPPEKLAELRVGMTRAEVTALLGPSRDVRMGGDGVECWTFGSRLKRHALIVEFSPAGVVREFAYGLVDARRATARGKV
jgi:outer membrane protein assembly factor BamE (lipoprotein component of BamABCDE complex)